MLFDVLCQHFSTTSWPVPLYTTGIFWKGRIFQTFSWSWLLNKLISSAFQAAGRIGDVQIKLNMKLGPQTHFGFSVPVRRSRISKIPISLFNLLNTFKFVCSTFQYAKSHVLFPDNFFQQIDFSPNLLFSLPPFSLHFCTRWWRPVANIDTPVYAPVSPAMSSLSQCLSGASVWVWFLQSGDSCCVCSCCGCLVTIFVFSIIHTLFSCNCVRLECSQILIWIFFVRTDFSKKKNRFFFARFFLLFFIVRCCRPIASSPAPARAAQTPSNR